MAMRQFTIRSRERSTVCRLAKREYLECALLSGKD